MRPARQQSRLRGGGSRQSRRCLFERLEQEEQRLKKHDGRWMAIQQSLLVRQPFFRKASNLWKTAYIQSAIISNNLQPICSLLIFFGVHILFVSITAHVVATVKNLYDFLHISVWSELFLIPKFRLTFKLILKINVYQYKIQQILHA